MRERRQHAAQDEQRDDAAAHVAEAAVGEDPAEVPDVLGEREARRR